MAFSLGKLILLLGMLVFASFGVVGAVAVGGGDLALDMTKSLAPRNASMEMNCPASQPPDQAGWQVSTFPFSLSPT